MRFLTLQQHSLHYHWRGHLTVWLGVVLGTAALTGALMVGDTLRGSLRAAALDRLGRVTHAVQSPRFFRAALGESLAAGADVAPAILTRGSAMHADRRTTVGGVDILAVDGRFWTLATPPGAPPAADGAGTVVLNGLLAGELQARVGDDVLLKVARRVTISPELLWGRPDEPTVALRLTVVGVIPAAGCGSFSLTPGVASPRIAYVPLNWVQRVLHAGEGVNTLLLAVRSDGTARDESRGSESAERTSQLLRDVLQRHLTLADAGLKLRTNEELSYVALESDAFLLSAPIEEAARAAATACGARVTAIMAYLANSITVEGRPQKAIPYSTVVALEPTPAWLASAELRPGEIILNEWAAGELGARIGETVRLAYYVSGPFGRRDTSSAAFRLAGIVPLAGATADPGLTPEYPGVTDAKSLAQWDPPFPIDMRQIRPVDEAYWEQHRATPKAFLSQADGRRLWGQDDARFGSLTALRVGVASGQTLAETQVAFEQELLRRLDPGRLGLRIEAVRARALAASTGSTDFGGLFIGFSFFLIVSAALLVALLFRLNVERRAGEVGLLLAIGFRPARVARLLIAEGAIVALAGALVGLLAARGYAWLMLTGLRHGWATGASTPLLTLHVAPATYVVGFAVSAAIAVLAVAGSLRGLLGRSARALLAGRLDSGQLPARGGRRLRPSLIGFFSLLTAIAITGLSFVTGVVRPPLAFFVGGAALLVAGLAFLSGWLHGGRHAGAHFTGPGAVARLGIRNARRHPGRSLLTAGLIAAATFIITALEALRADPQADPHAHSSGTGGFSLMAESTLPIVQDLNTPAGRAALNIGPQAEADLAGLTLVPFRVRPGDDASCLNLYRPMEPRVLGAPDALIARGGFAFASSLAATDRERRNPWELLHRPLADGVVPAVADEAAAQWQLHVKLGDELRIADERGGEVRLRLVALLRGSVLQGELIIAESEFTRRFPSVNGYAFFLGDAADGRSAAIEQTLERELADYGFAATSTRQRLADLRAVQNTYLTTFQTLGGFGLLLGTAGLAVVLLRNTWERRSELALLRTLGLAPAVIGWLALVENAFLVAAGLLIGLVSAAVVIAPRLAEQAAPVPWLTLTAMFAGILLAGLAAGVLALVAALRAPLLPALRAE